MVAPPMVTGALDLWGLFVNYVFGGFWIAVLGLCLLIFIILMLGRVSIYTTTIYVMLFFLAMTLGYGYVLLNVAITLFILVAFYFSLKGYIDRAGQ